jgi:hypothetical protein
MRFFDGGTIAEALPLVLLSMGCLLSQLRPLCIERLRQHLLHQLLVWPEYLKVTSARISYNHDKVST